MSNFRARAKEIKAAAQEQRGNFEPTGAPKRVYKYWLENSVSNKARRISAGTTRENFCHFWRVVVFWAPLLFVSLTMGRALTKLFSHKATLPTIISAAILVLGYVLVSTSSLISLLVGTGILLAATAVPAGLVFLFLYIKSEVWKSEWNGPVQKAAFLSMMSLTAFGLVFVIVMATLETGLIFLVVVGASVMAFSALIYLISKLSDFIEGRRVLAFKEKEAAYERFLNGEGPDPYEPQVREPGRLSKFFSGVGDFLVLVAQVVRTKKWKICPMVTIED